MTRQACMVGGVATIAILTAWPLLLLISLILLFDLALTVILSTGGK